MKKYLILKNSISGVCYFQRDFSKHSRDLMRGELSDVFSYIKQNLNFKNNAHISIIKEDFSQEEIINLEELCLGSKISLSLESRLKFK